MKSTIDTFSITKRNRCLINNCQKSQKGTHSAYFMLKRSTYTTAALSGIAASAIAATRAGSINMLTIKVAEA